MPSLDNDFYKLCYTPTQVGAYGNTFYNYKTMREEFQKGWLYLNFKNNYTNYIPNMFVSDFVSPINTISSHCRFADVNTLTLEAGRYYVEFSLIPFSEDLNVYTMNASSWGTWDYAWPSRIPATVSSGTGNYSRVTVGNILTLSSSTRLKFNNEPNTTLSTAFIVKISDDTSDINKLNYRPTHHIENGNRFIIDCSESNLYSSPNTFHTFGQVLSNFSNATTSGSPLVTDESTPDENRGFYKTYKNSTGSRPEGIYYYSFNSGMPSPVLGLEGSINAGEERGITTRGLGSNGLRTYHSHMDIRLGDYEVYPNSDMITTLPKTNRPFVKGVGFIQGSTNSSSITYNSTALTDRRGDVKAWVLDDNVEAVLICVIVENKSTSDYFDLKLGKNSHTFRTNVRSQNFLIKYNTIADSSVTLSSPSFQAIGNFKIFATFF